MKFFCFFAFALCALNAQAQMHWNYDSLKKIRVQGSLPWPKKDSTINQRKALLEKWVLNELSDAKASEISNWASDGQLPTTYAGLPGIAYLDYRKKAQLFRLTYDVKLAYSESGIFYTLSNFEYVVGEEDVSTSLSLEEAISSNKVSQEEINILRKRLFHILSGW